MRRFVFGRGWAVVCVALAAFHGTGCGPSKKNRRPPPITAPAPDDPAPQNVPDGGVAEDDLTRRPPGPMGTTPAAGAELDCEVLVVGGGTGGTAAALAISRSGHGVCITEETDWIGGQLTAQGLNASDDNRFTDKTGATRAYARLRALIRQQYNGMMNPGGCWVSYLCAEPSAALVAIEKLLRPGIDAGLVKILIRVKPVEAVKQGARLAGMRFRRVADDGELVIRAKQTIDATELGDAIALSGAGFRTGQEPRSDTGEADAPAQGCVDCVQSYTYDVILERRPPGENHVIQPPAGYGVEPWLSGFSHKKTATEQFPMFGSGSVWSYRRIVNGDALHRTDLSIMNWSDGNDYPFGNIIGKPPAEVELHLERARQRALAYVYWLQTEADGQGYPFLKLRPDLLGTTSGVAKTPYIREGRKLRALETIRVEDVSDFYVHASRARPWLDTVGIGLYPLDMHRNSATGSGWPRGHSLPFQIPLGALVPEALDGLIAGAKNIGTTHLTNSAYRLHPIEWTAGEAAGELAALCLDANIEARAVFQDSAHWTRALQDRLLAAGVPLYWTDDVLPADPDWRDIQLVAAIGAMGGPEATTIHYLPDAVINRAQTADALVRALGLEIVSPPDRPDFDDVPASHWAYAAIETLFQHGIVNGTGPRMYSPGSPVTRRQLRFLIARGADDATAARALPESSVDDQPAQRRLAAHALAAVVRGRAGL